MPRRKGIHCNLAVNMAKKRMETAKTNMLEAKVKNEERRAHRLKMRLNRLDKRVASLVNEVEDRVEIEKELRGGTLGSNQGGGSRQKLAFLSEKAAGMRRKKPTTALHKNVSVSTARQRCKETMQAAIEIHGGSQQDQRPGTVGLLDTMESRCDVKDIAEAISSDSGRKLMKDKVFPKVYKQDLCIFERSTQNMLRSIALYYGKGVMGKVKYMSACSNIVFERLAAKKKAVRIKVANCPIPKLVPYRKLMRYIRSIDIGKLFSVRETLCDGLEDAEKVIGCYRNLEDLVLKLAEFYLCNDLYDILTFGVEPYTFLIALGGDGAPFGKDDTACAWLVSILNIGRGVLSSNENFLLFGANCKEDCVPVKRFINILMKDISRIQSTTYTIPCKGSSVQAKFFVSELPNDMKMLAFLGGELSNSAKYYSSFADVTADDHKNAKGTFGKEKNCTWKPWEYAKRLEVAAEVVKMKAKVNVQPISEATKRSKVTKFIAGKKSRQEFAPLVGRLIDRAHVDPLHLKNNICALVHRHILNLVMSMSKLSSSVTCFNKVPHTSPFFLYIDTLRSKCCLSRLAKKVQKWFNDTNGKGKDFDYRFTGKDSRLFLHNFMFLIDVLEQLSTDMEKKVFHIHAYLCLCLRECVSLFCRVTISNEQVSRLQELCTSFFRGYLLFFNINSTIWTLGYVVPSHTREMKGKYGFGLGLNSMEGREAKHIAIAQYARNTVYRQRWEQIFLHEYISLIWLREKGYRISSVTPTTLSYIPARVKENGFCNCGLSKVETEDKCRFCNHSFRT